MESSSLRQLTQRQREATETVRTIHRLMNASGYVRRMVPSFLVTEHDPGLHSPTGMGDWLP
jgi:hypothetical protein